MSKVLITKQTLQDIADAIRSKAGTQATMSPSQMPTNISNISTGTDTSDADATAINIRNGKTAYVQGSKITGTLPVLTYPVNPVTPSDYNYQFIAGTGSAYTYNRDNTNYLVGTYQIAGNDEPDSWMFEGNRKMKLGIPYSKVVTAGGIAANKIKSGESIFGVNGNVIELQGQTKTVTPTSSQQVIVPDSGYNGLTQVTVNAASSPTLQNKSVTITENGTTNVIPDTGYDGLSNVEVITNVGSTSYPPDWSQIGYNTPPQIILDDFSYSKEIADNWDSSLTSLNSKFYNNKTLKYMPLVDTSNVLSLNSTWNSSSVSEIPLLDTSKVRSWVTTFSSCYNLTKIPPLSMAGATYGSSSMGIKQTFYYCSNLVDVPVLDVSNATVLDKMFENCPKLSDDSLNNIMQMCINSKVTLASYKTLRAVGLSSAQATKCQSLSNWTAFTAAGWTSGY